jgi:hypothetical protein
MTMARPLGVLAVLCIPSVACDAGHSGAAVGANGAHATASASVTVSVGSATRPVNPAFVGLSYEKNSLASGLFTQTNANLVGLFRGIGPGVLRVGGNTVNEVVWDAAGGGMTRGRVAPSDVDRLAAFVGAAGWQVIYGLDVAKSTPAESAAEAAYAARALGDGLLAFEIGNEPDLYSRNGIRAATYDEAAFEEDWESYASAIRARVPGAVFSGPAAAHDYAGFTVPFAAHARDEIRLLTHHYYRANGQASTSTIDLLLSPDPHLAPELDALDLASRTISDGYRLAEANSFYHGGAPGVSDGFGTALWVLDFLFTLAEHGASGVNLHGGGHGPGYTPIADDDHGNVVGVRPEYYGLALFARASRGVVLEVQVAGAPELAAHAVNVGTGEAIVLINKSRTDDVTALVEPADTFGSAETLSLTGPSLDSTTGAELGGASVEVDGTVAPTFGQVSLVDEAKLGVTVPAGSAILVLTRF